MNKADRRHEQPYHKLLLVLVALDLFDSTSIFKYDAYVTKYGPDQ